MSDAHFIDPKSAFLFSLNEKIVSINNDLFNYANVHAAHKMCIIIQSLDIPEGDEFKDIRFLRDKWDPEFRQHRRYCQRRKSTTQRNNKR